MSNYGIYICNDRPQSKREIRDAISTDPSSVFLENTSMYGGWSGTVANAPEGTYVIVGPDPWRIRKFYGQVIVKPGGKFIVT